MLKNKESIRKQNLNRVIYASLGLMAMLVAFIAAQNLISQIYSQLGYPRLGQICMFLYFAFFAIGSLMSPYFKQKISIKAGLIAGAIPYVGFVLAGVLTTFCNKYGYEEFVCGSGFISFFNLLCAFLLGVGAAILWLCHGLYIDACSTENDKGFFNGLSWSIFQSAQVWSSMLAAILLGSTDQFTFYSILFCSGVISIVMLSFVQPPVPYTSDPITVSPEGTLAESLQNFGRLLGEKPCHFLFSGILLSGMAIGCYISSIAFSVASTIDSTNPNEINKLIGYVLIVLSCAEVIAGLSIGKLADRMDKVQLFTFTMILNEIALGLTIAACMFHNYAIALVAGFFWGYGDTAIQTMIGAVIGSMFNGRPELFSAYRFFQSCGLMYSALIAIFIPRTAPIIYLCVIAASMGIVHMLYRHFLSHNPRTSAKNDSYKALIELDNM